MRYPGLIANQFNLIVRGKSVRHVTEPKYSPPVQNLIMSIFVRVRFSAEGAGEVAGGRHLVSRPQATPASGNHSAKRRRLPNDQGAAGQTAQIRAIQWPSGCPSLPNLAQTHLPQRATHRGAIVVGDLPQLGNVLEHYMRRIDDDTNAPQPREGTR